MRASRAVALVLVVSLLPSVAVGGSVQNGGPCAGTVTAPADGVTVVSVQGFSVHDRQKQPAYLVGVGPRATIEWVFPATDRLGAYWSYDVDPLDDGTLFVTATRSEATLLFELDPRTGDVVWSAELTEFADTHDADLLDEHRVLLANMRNYDETSERNDEGVVIYNRTSGEVEWRWLFRENGFEADGGGNYSEDWTHVNDVDRVREGEYLASVRNFDQVVLVDRSTGDVDLRLGEDGNESVLDQQHNPHYLESDDGNATLLVGDSDNDRIVEYERSDGGWMRTWSVGEEDDHLQWPRDADRLPDGNTLVVDSLNHRVVEVTPDGEVVWEFYAPWLPYDAERIELGDEPGGPTMADVGTTGSQALTNGESRPADELDDCASALSAAGDESTAADEDRTDGDGTEDAGASTDDGRTAGDGRTDVGTAPDDDGPTSSPGQRGFGGVGLLAAVVALIVLARQSS